MVIIHGRGPRALEARGTRAPAQLAGARGRASSSWPSRRGARTSPSLLNFALEQGKPKCRAQQCRPSCVARRQWSRPRRSPGFPSGRWCQCGICGAKGNKLDHHGARRRSQSAPRVQQRAVTSTQRWRRREHILFAFSAAQRRSVMLFPSPAPKRISFSASASSAASFSSAASAKVRKSLFDFGFALGTGALQGWGFGNASP